MTTEKEIIVGKVVGEITVNGNQIPKIATTFPNVQPEDFVITFPGVGNKFWYWPSIPAKKVIAVDFNDAPTVDSDPAVNAASIAAITALPDDVLTYAP